MKNNEITKVLIIGVGNSGTKLLGSLVNDLLNKNGYPEYHYEPLYWKGTNGEKRTKLNYEGIKEHVRFPLLPDNTISEWKWMDEFIDRLAGLAKFIRAGSRIKYITKHTLKIIWITRELYSYLGSMQKNFPRPKKNDGWHHRPGQYDDYERIRQIYSEYDLLPDEEYRIEVEAAWWHLHNKQMYDASITNDIYHIKYEELCKNPEHILQAVARYIGVAMTEISGVEDVYLSNTREVTLSSRNYSIINNIAGSLNTEIYGYEYGNNIILKEI